MKETEVLVKVYEPERLQMAWQQVRKNAGAAGIDHDLHHYGHCQLVFRQAQAQSIGNGFRIIETGPALPD